MLGFSDSIIHSFLSERSKFSTFLCWDIRIFKTREIFYVHLSRLTSAENTHSCPAFEMLWKLLFSLAAFFIRPFHGAPAEEIEYEVSPVGPQSWREAQIAMQAMQGDNDMRFHEDHPLSAGIRDEKFRWPGYPGNATVPYEIDDSLKSIKGLIEQSMEQYHNLTCIKFVPRTNEENYILIFKHRGCYSYVGNQRRGGQLVSIGRGCEYIGIIVHELGHAIGLYHEHQRSDRDKYLDVYLKNVTSGRMHNFDKINSSVELTFDLPYDYKSIMHYGEYAFSRQPGKKKTMEAKDGTPLKEPYEKDGLDDHDVDLIKKLYKCE